jgi:hypothetical protein
LVDISGSGPSHGAVLLEIRSFSSNLSKKMKKVSAPQEYGRKMKSSDRTPEDPEFADEGVPWTMEAVRSWSEFWSLTA